MTEVHGGRFGVVNNIAAVRDWAINDEGTLAAFRNSATANGMGRRAGVLAWNGSYQAHGAVPAVLPAAFFSFLGYTAPDNDTLGGTGETYAGNAIVDAVNINWDWAGGQIINHAVNFSGNLGLTATPTDTAISDSSWNDPESTNGTVIKYSPDGTTWTTLGNLTQASLGINASNPSFVNSSTAGLTGRRAGPIDWSLQLSIESNLNGSGLVKGTSYQWRLYTTATLFYLLKWGRVKGFSGLNVNRETGTIIAHSIQVEMDATVGGVAGSILMPGGASYWP